MLSACWQGVPHAGTTTATAAAASASAAAAILALRLCSRICQLGGRVVCAEEGMVLSACWQGVPHATAASTASTATSTSARATFLAL